VKRPHLLLVIVDDLRADRTGFAGLASARTPFLDQLAQRGARYSRCFTTTGWTLPACASIVTGRLPSGHGLIHHDRRFEAQKIPALLGPDYATFGVGNNGNLVPDTISGEALDAAGFERRPEVWKHFGWQEGFETYEWHYKADKDGPFESFGRWLGARADDDRPWFAMLHTNVVHDYDRDDPWCVDVEPFLGGPLPDGLRAFRDGPWVWREPPGGLDDEALARALLAKYDGCVAEFDRRLRAALAPVDLERTVVLVVSDHGEGFDGPRERVHHCGRLHDDLLRVPLLLLLPPGTPDAPQPGAVIDHAASIRDGAPTLLALAGVTPDGLPGTDLRRLPATRSIEAEDLGYLYLPRGDVSERLRRFDYKTYDVITRCTVDWPTKRIRSRIGRQEWNEEYDLELDPLECVNRATGAQAPIRRPRRQESVWTAAVRARAADSREARRLRFAWNYASFARRSRKRRRLPPVVRHVPFDQIPGREPISFVVAVDDPAELAWHVLPSECFRHGAHQWLFVENGGNRAYTSISRLYVDALERVEHDLVFFVHQDVFFPPDWEQRLFTALAELERSDPEWGVIGAAGRALPETAAAGDDLPLNVGHWSDPHRYHKPRVPLPAGVQVLDELWLGTRRSRGVAFDPELPGFHCYGADLCLTARAQGLASYVIDAPVVHKLFRPDGTLIERSEQSQKIATRTGKEFRRGFHESVDHVRRKWQRFLPFASTCHVYEALDDSAGR